jgi:2-polyprenyl-6-methoxyphenol hydroxylase-like FAD-dependent oxidoreductase
MVSDVVVAGAGIGGLTLALALRHRGIRVRVFERANQLTVAGAGIALPANGVKALQTLSLGRSVMSAGMVVARAAILDSRGRPLGPEVDLTPVYDTMGASLVALHRARLHSILLDAVGPDTVIMGRQVVSFEQNESAVHVALMNGDRVDADLLIGADGLHSVIRAQLTGKEPPAYSGYTSWRGVTPGHAVQVPHRTSESWGRGERFGIVPIGFGEIYWFAVANAPPNGRDAEVHRELMERFGSWHEPIAGIIRATPPDRILRTDICDRTPIERWHQGRVALLGDAAHPMTPNLGQGAGQAIEDAVVLAECLAAIPTLEEALIRYEQRRVARANGIASASRRLGAMAQWSHPVAAWIRDRAMRLMPASVAVNQARRLMEES